MQSRSSVTEVHRRRDEIGVVDDVVVGERRALRRACRARGELDVDGVAGLQRFRDQVEALVLVAAAARHHVGEIEHARRIVVAHADDEFQLRQPGGLQPARLGGGELRRQRLDHAEIVGGLEADGADQRAAADLVERIFQLGEAVGRVDVDQHQADARGGKLRQQPLPAVRRPDADAVALLQAERQQAGRQRVDRLGEFVPRKALVLRRRTPRRRGSRWPGRCRQTAPGWSCAAAVASGRPRRATAHRAAQRRCRRAAAHARAGVSCHRAPAD